MQLETLKTWIEFFENNMSRFLECEILADEKMLVLKHQPSKNNYILKIHDIETIRKIGDDILIVTENKAFVYIDDLHNKISVGI